jgi:hypothetical protein
VAWVVKATLLQTDTLGKAGRMIKAHAVPVPSDSVLAPLYVGADLLDAFAIHLPAGADDDLEVLARAGFERPAGWIRALTRVRDAVMAGVKSSRAIGAAAAAREPVMELRNSELQIKLQGHDTNYQLPIPITGT